MLQKSGHGLLEAMVLSAESDVAGKLRKPRVFHQGQCTARLNNSPESTPLLRIAYFVTSFPEPSETFIVDEMASMLSLGVDAYLLYLKQSNAKVAPLKAVAIQQAGRAKRLDRRPLVRCLLTLLSLLVRRPFRTLRVLARSWTHSHRWIYMQALEAAAWCGNQRIQMLHAHFAAENFIYAKAVSDWTGIPVGVTTHRYDLFDEPLDPDLLQDLYGHAATIVTISEYNKRFMMAQYGLAAERIAIVHCGIDTQRFSFREQACEWAGRPLRLLNVGRLVPAKAHDVLLGAVSELTKMGIDVQLEVVGGGPDEQALTRLAQTLGVADRVTWHGAQSDTFVWDALCRADLFVLPSRAEGLPVALMEAMASGVPVVSTRVFGIPELVVDGEGGLLVPPDDEKALTGALAWAAENSQAMDAMRRRARTAVVHGFDRATCSRQLLERWAQAVAKGTHEES